MKRTRILIVLLFSALPVWGGLRFGLGNAVAKRSAELIDKTAANAVGEYAAALLPACPASEIYDSAPTDVSMVGGIDPLGHVFPSGHTFPSDHIYYYASGGGVTLPVYAPGDIHIIRVSMSQNLTAGYTDYSIWFYACRNVKSYYHHVRTLSASLAAQFGTIGSNCMTSTTGGTTYHSCYLDTNITLQSGALMGYAATSGAFDFGTYDYRITPLAFISPSRKFNDKLYTVCPIDYFTSGPRASMQAKLGSGNGSYQRVTAPICGQVMFDLAGTAKGDWYHPGSPDLPEDPHLSLIDDNVYAGMNQMISIGTSLPNSGAAYYMFATTSVGQVNRDLSQVTVDGNIYCYDSFLGPNNLPLGFPTPVLILQLTSATTLRFERQNPGTCGAGPWAFTGNAVNFQR